MNCLESKAHPMGNECHTTAYCQSNIIFLIELAQGNNLLNEGEHSEIGFEIEFARKLRR